MGCGSAKPTTRHQPTSQILNVRGKFFMIDCGEGAQAQMQRMGLSMMNIGHIFISHNHGDHVFGLPGLIGTMDLLGRTAELHIHGPQQVVELLQFLMSTYYAEIQYKVLFHPVDVSKHELIFEDRSITVHSIPRQHRIPSVGFRFREKPNLPHIRREMIDAYNMNQKHEFKADVDAMTYPNWDEDWYARMYYATMMWFAALAIYEAAEDTIFPPNGRQTHPGAKARYQNLLDNAPKTVNFDKELYCTRIPELVSWWEEHIREDVMENFEMYEMYGSLYLAAPNTEWRGRELIDRVDY